MARIKLYKIYYIPMAKEFYIKALSKPTKKKASWILNYKKLIDNPNAEKHLEITRIIPLEMIY